MAPGNDAGDGAVGDIRLYDFEKGNLVGLFRGHRKAVWALAFSPDDQRLVSGSEDNSAIIWDVSKQQRLHQLLLGGEVRAVGFSRDGLSAVTGDYNKKLTLWRASDGTKLSEQTSKDKVRALASSFPPSSTAAIRRFVPPRSTPMA